MNAKEYLGQAYRLDQHINDRLMQLSQLRALTQRITTACDARWFPARAMCTRWRIRSSA